LARCSGGMFAIFSFMAAITVLTCDPMRSASAFVISVYDLRLRLMMRSTC
jgi:hypothetical protein